MTKRIIDLEAFEKLEPEKQMELLHKDGVHIGKQTINNQKAILYQLNDFYVEVLYKSYRKVIEHITVTNNINHLIPYLDQIKVKDLDKDI